MEGKRQGKWVRTYADGEYYAPYVNGKMHGYALYRSYRVDEDGLIGTNQGIYLDGEEHGKWVFRHPNGDIVKLEFRNGKEQYPKLWYDYDEEKCWSVYDYKKRKR